MFIGNFTHIVTRVNRPHMLLPHGNDNKHHNKKSVYIPKMNPDTQMELPFESIESIESKRHVYPHESFIGKNGMRYFKSRINGEIIGREDKNGIFDKEYFKYLINKKQ